MWYKSLWLNVENTLKTEKGSLERKILLLRVGQIATMVVALLIGLSFLWRPDNHTQLIFTILGVGFFFWLGNNLRLKTKFLLDQARLRAEWGKLGKKVREFPSHTDLFDMLKEQEDAFFIDDRTWMDLDMESIYFNIDRTLTTPGEQYLYYLLRKPEMQLKELERRNRVVERLQSDEKLRHSLQLSLAKIGREGGEGIVPFIFDELPSDKNGKLPQLLYLLSLVAIGITVFYPTYWLFTILPIFGINMYVHYYEKRQIYRYLGALFYLGRFLAQANHIAKAKFEDKEMVAFQQELKDALRSVKKLTRKTAVFVMRHDPFAEYFFIFSLKEVRTFYNVLGTIRKHQAELQKVYRIIAELDGYLSIASYRTGLNYYTVPELSTLHRRMEVADLYHPLLKDPVSNSLHLRKNGALITGSNMSGKSTLLRAVGINALLSQTIYTSLSRVYKGSFYKITTSIGRSDNVITGDSYYLVEAKALKRIIDSLSDVEPVLCIVDEIFRGTNSLERIAASAQVLRYLSRANCLTFAATHDLELTGMLENDLENYHFKEIVDERGLSFDYQLRPGPSTTRNAINLLDHLGYPAVIIENARDLIVAMEQKTAIMGKIT